MAAAGTVGVAAGLATHRDVLLLCGAALFGLGYGAVQNRALVLTFARAGEGGLPVASAVVNAGFDAGTGLGPLVVGVLSTLGLGVPAALVLAAALIGVTVPVAVLVGRPARAAAGAPARSAC